MDTNLVWFRVSLFANRKNWHVIMRQFIYNFLEEYQNTIVGGNINVELSIEGGDNIRFSFQTLKMNSIRTATATEKYFKTMFASKQFKIAKSTTTTQGVFKGFPENTIQYGLYQILPQVNKGPMRQICNELSRQIIYCLSTQKMLESNLLIFGYNLIMRCFVEFFRQEKDPKNRKMIMTTFSISKDKMGMFSSEMKDFFESSYTQYNEYLKVICVSTACQSLESNRSTLNLEEWSKICQSVFKLADTHSASFAKKMEMFSFIRHIVCHHLCLKNESISLLNYFAYRTILDMNFNM